MHLRWLYIAAFLLVGVVGSCGGDDEPPDARSDAQGAHSRLATSLRLELSGPAELVSGTLPRLSARVVNNSANDVMLVRILDGSESRMRLPIYTLDVSRDGAAIDVFSGFGRCGNMNELVVDDFVRVRPGGELDLFPNGGSPCDWMSPQLFAQPGAYKFRISYSTDDSAGERFLGFQQTPEPTLSDLIDQVPRLTLLSNEITINVSRRKTPR